jgi:hypothetical protein
MRTRRLSLMAAALMAITPSSFAQELRPGVPAVLYYISFPLDGATRKDKEPLVGFAYQGSRAYQVVRFDNRVMNLLEAGAFEAKWLIAGAVAAGAVVAVAGKDKSVTQQQQQQAQQQQAQQQQQQQQQQSTQPPRGPCVC